MNYYKNKKIEKITNTIILYKYYSNHYIIIMSSSNWITGWSNEDSLTHIYKR